MNRRKKAKRIVVATLLLTAMLIHPVGRAVLIFLWPIDPGHEDTVVLVVLLTAFVILWTQIPKLSRRGK